ISISSTPASMASSQLPSLRNRSNPGRPCAAQAVRYASLAERKSLLVAWRRDSFEVASSTLFQPVLPGLHTHRMARESPFTYGANQRIEPMTRGLWLLQNIILRYSRLQICATRERFMESILSFFKACIGTMNLRSGTAFGVLAFSRRHRRSPLRCDLRLLS